MIPARLNEIGEETLRQLIVDEVREGKTIEYKRDLPGNSDDDKREFLADFSSFGNTVGGDLIWGVTEAGGLPTAVDGVQVADQNQELLRLEQVTTSGLEPRLTGYEFRFVPLANGHLVLIARIRKSWNAPHRVVFKDWSKFFGRNSAGKYALDVSELRAAFNVWPSLVERISSFRTERLLKIRSDDIAIPLSHSARLVMHLVPIGLDEIISPELLARFHHAPHTFMPSVQTSLYERRYDFEGVLLHSRIDQSGTGGYVQLFRNGALEFVDCWHFMRMDDGRIMIPSQSFEELLVRWLRGGFECMRALEIDPPVFVFISLLGVRGARMGLPGGPPLIEVMNEMQQDDLLLAGVTIDNYDTDPAVALHGSIDQIYNTCGLQGSPYRRVTS